MYIIHKKSDMIYLHMILAHVLVAAIDYYAKCPNLKKPDSLSSNILALKS